MRHFVNSIVPILLLCAPATAIAAGLGGMASSQMDNKALPGTTSVTAASTSQMSQCNSPDPQKAIIGCNLIIRTATGSQGEATLIKAEGPSLIAMAYAGRGMAHEKLGEHDLAIADLNEAVRIGPKTPDAFNARGNFYLADGDAAHALPDYDQTIVLSPKSSSAYANRGEAHRLLGDADAAISDYGQSIKLDGKNVGAFLDRGLAFEDKGDLMKAIADFSQAIRLNSKYVPAFDERAQAYEHSGDHAHAMADIAQAIKLDPKNADQHHLQ